MKPKSFPTELTWTFAVFALMLMFVSSAQAANKYKVLHHFLNNPASHPETALVADPAGNLYGTTRFSSGKCDCGAIFKLTRQSGGKWTYSVIHLFKGPDGAAPMGSLVFDSAGNLYGTTQNGGTYDNGVAFELSPSANQWKEKVLYSFGVTSDDLQAPQGAVSFDTSGNLYGTASSGGAYLVQGGIFELKRSGSRWKEIAIYGFTGGPDGGDPMGNLVWDPVGNLYGTTFSGGHGFGLVFELSPSSDGTWTESVLYTFARANDGCCPTSGVIRDPAGNLYGTSPESSGGSGTVYELTSSMGNWSFSLLHTFLGADGATPHAGLTLDSTGNLFGTTEQGGAHDDGVVFKLSQSGNSWTEDVIYSFDVLHGVPPSGELILDQQGAIYGTAGFGGVNGSGVVFSITP